MQLTLRSNHAMRLVMYCAVNEGKVAPVAEIARACNMSETHLAKIANRLAALGFVETLRGRAGGVRLAHPPEELNVGEIVRASEFGRSLVECLSPETNTCPLIKVCRFRTVIIQALDAFLAVLDRYTVADLVEEQEALRNTLGLSSPEAPSADLAPKTASASRRS